MANTNPENRHIAIDQLFDFRDSKFSCCGRIARPVGQKNTIGLACKNIIGTGTGRYHIDNTSCIYQTAQDILLAAKIHRHNVQAFLAVRRAVCLKIKAACRPGEIFFRRDHTCQIHPFQARPVCNQFLQGWQVKLAIGAVA